MAAIESSFTLGIVVDGVQEACPGANLDMWKYRRSRPISCSFAGRPMRAVSRPADMMEGCMTTRILRFLRLNRRVSIR